VRHNGNTLCESWLTSYEPQKDGKSIRTAAFVAYTGNAAGMKKAGIPAGLSIAKKCGANDALGAALDRG
jgi:hypothetical protein